MACYRHPPPPVDRPCLPTFLPACLISRAIPVVSIAPLRARNRGHVRASFTGYNSGDRDCANPPGGDIHSPCRRRFPWNRLDGHGGVLDWRVRCYVEIATRKLAGEVASRAHLNDKIERLAWYPSRVRHRYLQCARQYIPATTVHL